MSRHANYKTSTKQRADERRRALGKRMEREHFGLDPEQHNTVNALTTDSFTLMHLAAARGAIEVGEIGGELARLQRAGFIEIKPTGFNGHHLASCTADGLRALLLKAALKAATTTIGRVRQALALDPRRAQAASHQNDKSLRRDPCGRRRRR